MSDHSHTGFTERSNGFAYDTDKIDDELGIIRHNGIRLYHDRMNGQLIIEREQLSLDEIISELESLKSNNE